MTNKQASKRASDNIKKQINEIESQYPYLHIDLHRDQFKSGDVNKLFKLYKLLNQQASERATGKMKKYKITFVDEIEAKNLKEAYYQLRLYLSKCEHYQDITGFEFKEIKQQASEQKG